MAKEASQRIKLLNPGNLDDWYGPYNSLALANAAMPQAFRAGKTVGILLGGSIIEYVWHPSDISDAGLGPKYSASGASFKGGANPGTNPGAPTKPEFWTGETGVYPNFGGVEITGDWGILAFNGISWTVDNINGSPIASQTNNILNTKRSGNTIYDLIDQFTGEYISVNKATTKTNGAPIADADVDNVIFFKIGSEYFKRNSDGIVNVRWFGAKGDSTTDDTDAFQSAINTGLHVLVPRGEYVIYNTLTNTGDFILVGDESTCRIQEVNPHLHKSGSCIIYRGLPNRDILSPNPDVCSSRVIKNLNFFIQSDITGVFAIDINGYKWREANGITLNTGFKGIVEVDNVGLYPEPIAGGVPANVNSSGLLRVRCTDLFQSRFLFGARFANLYAIAMNYGVKLECLEPATPHAPPAYFFNFINGNNFDNIMFAQVWQPIIISTANRAEVSHNCFYNLQVQPLIINGLATEGQIRTIGQYAIENSFIGGKVYDLDANSKVLKEDREFSTSFIGIAPSRKVKNKFPAPADTQNSRSADFEREISILRDTGFAYIIMGNLDGLGNFNAIKSAGSETQIGSVDKLDNDDNARVFTPIANFSRSTRDIGYYGNGIYGETEGANFIIYVKKLGLKTEVARFTNTGKLLLGKTTAGSAIFDIVGNAVVSGNITATGNLMVGNVLELYNGVKDGTDILTIPNNRAISIADSLGNFRRALLLSALDQLTIGDIDNACAKTILKGKNKVEILVNNISVGDFSPTGLEVKGQCYTQILKIATLQIPATVINCSLAGSFWKNLIADDTFTLENFTEGLKVKVMFQNTSGAVRTFAITGAIFLGSPALQVQNTGYGLVEMEKINGVILATYNKS